MSQPEGVEPTNKKIKLNPEIDAEDKKWAIFFSVMEEFFIDGLIKEDSLLTEYEKFLLKGVLSENEELSKNFTELFYSMFDPRANFEGGSMFETQNFKFLNGKFPDDITEDNIKAAINIGGWQLKNRKGLIPYQANCSLFIGFTLF